MGWNFGGNVFKKTVSMISSDPPYKMKKFLINIDSWIRSYTIKSQLNISNIYIYQDLT